MSEWCGHGPFLEEDIAMANSALDYVGRARLLYTYAASIDSVEGRDEDFYAFCRDESEFQNLQICELPNGDYAFTILRQFLFDHYCVLSTEHLVDSINHQINYPVWRQKL